MGHRPSRSGHRRQLGQSLFCYNRVFNFPAATRAKEHPPFNFLRNDVWISQEVWILGEARPMEHRNEVPPLRAAVGTGLGLVGVYFQVHSFW